MSIHLVQSQEQQEMECRNSEEEIGMGRRKNHLQLRLTKRRVKGVQVVDTQNRSQAQKLRPKEIQGEIITAFQYLRGLRREVGVWLWGFWGFFLCCCCWGFFWGGGGGVCVGLVWFGLFFGFWGF